MRLERGSGQEDVGVGDAEPDDEQDPCDGQGHTLDEVETC